MYTISYAQNALEQEKAFGVRTAVFVEEQHVPAEIEMDEYDNAVDTRQLLIYSQDGNVIGTGRFRPYDKGICKVERIAILAEYRGTGAGTVLMEAIENEACKAGFNTLKLSAQIHARNFYERLGYQAKGNIFIEANIEHLAMEKQI